MAGQVKFTTQEVSFFQTQAETARKRAQELDGVKWKAGILYEKWKKMAPDDAEFNRENLQIQKAISDLEQWRKALEDTHYPTLRKTIRVRPDLVPDSERDTFKTLQDHELTTKMSAAYFDERLPKAKTWTYSLETFRDSVFTTVGKWTRLASATTFTPQPPKKELENGTPEFEWNELAVSSMQKAKELAWLRSDAKIVKRKWDQAAPDNQQFSKETQKAQNTLQELQKWRGTAQNTANSLLMKNLTLGARESSASSIADNRLTTDVAFSHFDRRYIEVRTAVEKLTAFRDPNWPTPEPAPSVTSNASNPSSAFLVPSETAYSTEDEPGSPNAQPLTEPPLEFKTQEPTHDPQPTTDTPPLEPENSQHDPGVIVQTLPPQSRFDWVLCCCPSK